MFRLIVLSILITLAGCVDQSRDVSEAGSPVGSSASESSASADVTSSDGVVSESDTNPKREVLLNVGENIILPAYKALRDDAAVFSGDGNADKAAVQKMVMLELKLNTPPKPDDAADALSLALSLSFELR